MRDIKYTKYSNIIQSIQQDKPFIKVAMQTVVFNAQLRYRAEVMYFFIICTLPLLLKL